MMLQIKRCPFFLWSNRTHFRINGRECVKRSFCTLYYGPWMYSNSNASVRWFNPFRLITYAVRLRMDTGAIHLTAREMAVVQAEPYEKDSLALAEWFQIRSNHLDFLLTECQFQDYQERRPVRAFLAAVWHDVKLSPVWKSWCSLLKRLRPSKTENIPSHDAKSKF